MSAWLGPCRPCIREQQISTRVARGYADLATGLIREIRVPDAVQRVALAERCSADPGPLQATIFVAVPGLQRTASRCAAPGTRNASIRVARGDFAGDLGAFFQ